MTPLSILRVARDFLAADPSRLARHGIAFKGDRLQVAANDPRVESCCVVGAILRARGVASLPGPLVDPGATAMHTFRVANAIEPGAVAWWSDQSDHPTIVAAFDKAIALAECGGAS